MENSSPIESLFDKAKEYLEIRLDLLKLKAIDKSSEWISNCLTMVILGIFGLFFLVLFNIGLALLIGYLLGNSFWGFFIVAALYIIIGVVIYSFRKKWLKAPIATMMIKSLLDK
ncbi:hypothetical protein BH09BAC2_BH09BAC2_06920 [soil metagenome]